MAISIDSHARMESRSSPVDRPKPVVGLAGGIASGKSLVAEILADLGAAVIDADQINHEVLHRQEVRRQIQSWWGEDTYDSNGHCNRQRLAEIVFDCLEDKNRLEKLTHPLIEQQRRQMMAEFEQRPDVSVIVINAPLLFEVGLDKRCNQIIFVDADEQIRIERARETRGWNRAELQRREKLQNPLDTKQERADYIVENNSDVSALRQKVESVYCRLISPVSRPPKT